jgi:hypothetical protein
MSLKMRLLLVLILSVSVFNMANSQVPPLSFINAEVYGDGEGKNDEVNAICSDASGNLYVFGRFAGAVDFDPSNNIEVYSSGSSTRDLYLAKYDSTHQLVWFNHLLGSSNNNANDMVLDNSGNIVVCGSFVKDIDFDPTSAQYVLNSTTYNNSDGFIAKYTSSGQLIWANKVGGNSVDGANALTIDAQNNIYITGGFSDTADFNPSSSAYNLYSTGFQDPYLAKYTSNGSFVWAFSIPGSGLPGYGQSLEMSHDGNILLAGVFNGTVDFDPSLSFNLLTTNGNLDGFIAKYSTSGTNLWAKNFGGTYEDMLYDIAISTNGNIYATGYFQNTADFNPSSGTNTLTSSGGKDIYVAKYDANGNYKWAHGFGNSSTDQGEGIDIDANENVYMGGYFVNQVDFDPSSGTANITGTGADAFIASYDSLGAYRWVIQTSGSGFEQMADVHINNYGKTYGGGYFTGSADLDPGTGITTVSAANSSYSGFLAAYKTSNGAFNSGFAFKDREGEHDEGKKIIHDNQGNYYTCGYFQGGVDFDPSAGQTYLDAGGYTAGYICKYNAANNLLWAKMIKGTSNVSADDISLDQQGNVIVTGWMMGVVDLNPGAGVQNETSSGSSDVFVVKLNTNGQFIWGKRMGGPSNDEGWAIATDKNNDIYVTGYFRSTADFDPGAGTANLIATNRDIFLVKLNSSGNYQWAFKTGGVSNDYGTSVCTDTLNNIIIGGYFRSNSDFDPSANTYNLSSYVSGLYDPFIAKYSSSGNFLWARSYGGYQSDYIYDLHLDEEGDIYAVGSFKDTVDMDPGTGVINIHSNNSSYYDVFVLKVDKNGNSLWAKSFGGGSGSYPDDYPYDLDYSSGNLYITGYFRDTIDFDPGPGTVLGIGNGGMDVYVNILDSAGNYLNSATFGGPSTDIGQSISVFGTNVYTTGYFQGYADFDPGTPNYRLNGFGDKDIFVHQLGSAIPCSSTLDTITPIACRSYTSPSGMIINQSGVYYDSIPFGNGCDSVFRIELTVNPTSRDTINVHGCYTYYDSISSQILTSEGFYTRNLLNVFNCDSIIVLNVSLDTSSYDTSAIACDSFYWHGNTYYSTGIYYDTLQNSKGCDSLIELSLTILNSTTNTLNPVVCNSYTSPSGNHTWTSSGTFYDTLINAAGCDSIITVNLIVNNSSTSGIYSSACGSYTSPSGNHTWTTSGNYTDTIQNSIGCDSIISVYLTINNTTTSSISPIDCDSYTSPSGNYSWTASGNYVDTIPNVNGCDSIISINLTIGNTTVVNTNPVVCGSYTSPSGNYTWTSSGNYVDTIPNATGCDSVFNINLTVNSSTTSTINPVVCGSYTSPSGNYTWTASGNYMDTISNTNGCDSIISINLTVNNSTNSTIYPAACGSYTSPSGNYTWTSSGNYLDTILNSNGCDSIISINLTINSSTSSTINPVACSEYTSPSGNYLWTTSGIYTDTVVNSNGCDSIININLIIINLDTSVTYSPPILTSNLSAATYQWIDCSSMNPIAGATNQSFTPTQNGYYAVILTKNSCVDTSNCHHISDVGLSNLETRQPISVYPNPTNGHVYIQFDKVENFIELSLYSIDGRLIKQEEYFNIKSLATTVVSEPGVYTIVLKNNSIELLRQKLIKY